MIKVSPLTKCVKCTFIETYYGFTINKEWDKRIDPLTFEPYGNASVFYTVNDGEWMLESFKTIKEARQYITKLL